MSDRSDPPPSVNLPEDLVAQLQELDKHQLHETIYYAQTLLNRQLESGEGALEIDDENVVQVEERSGYTEVVRREPFGDVLYHVVNIRNLEGTEKLEWRYIGPIVDR